MKKVLFLMFLLSLITLGAANVNAQVRIGGNTAPNASAVLDLNANDTNSGTKGLALPRVALTSNTMLLSGVTANLTGMMVYNTSTTGVGVNIIGIYFWNGATWVKASLPSTSAADSGKVLMSNGSQLFLGYHDIGTWTDTLHLTTLTSPPLITWQKTLDTTVAITTRNNAWSAVPVTNMVAGWWCVSRSIYGLDFLTWAGTLYYKSYTNGARNNVNVRICCYAPSL